MKVEDLWDWDAEGQVDKALTITSILGGSVGILVYIFIFDEYGVKVRG